MLRFIIVFYNLAKCKGSEEPLLLLLGRVRANVLQGTDDVRGDWWGHWQVPAAGSVTVGVRGPGEFVSLSLRVGVSGDAVGHVAAES